MFLNGVDVVYIFCYPHQPSDYNLRNQYYVPTGLYRIVIFFSTDMSSLRDFFKFELFAKLISYLVIDKTQSKLPIGMRYK